MSTKRTRPITPKAEAESEGASGDVAADQKRDPLDYDPLMIALSKAESARWLLYELAEGGEIERLTTEDTHAWLTFVALDTLKAALDEAKAAFLKQHEHLDRDARLQHVAAQD